MEILSRLLRRLHRVSLFSYHPKCLRVGLTHLLFADDLMIFVRGDLPSVMAAHSALHDFSTWSGLTANPGKTNIYFGGVKPSIKALILASSGFIEDTFPFRYLGIPLNSARLSVEMHHLLIHRIKSKLFHWTSQHLSYAGKIQLINSVIFGLENFWCSCLLLPKSVIKQIDKMCKQFLWGYKEGARKHVWMSWSKVCRPRKEGGFDIREILSWNKALMMRWVWKLQLWPHSIWARWMISYVLKGGDLFSAQASPTSSSTWKGILMVRDELSVLQGGQQQAIQALAGWTKNERLQVSLVYELFRYKGECKRWHKVVWDHIVTPRHSVIGVLAVQNHLATIDNLVLRGIQMPNRCSLCCNAAESSAHLFFVCPFSKEVIQHILLWNRIQRRPLSLKREIKWQLKFNRGRGWRKKWLRCSLLATIYFIWRERNARIFAEQWSDVSQLVYKIKYVVCVRLYNFKQGCDEVDMMDDLVV